MVDFDNHPWLWLGVDPVRVSYPPDRRWEPREPDDGWRIVLKDKSRWLKQVGTRLGLGHHSLDRMVLEELLGFFEDAAPPWIFAPPYQLNTLARMCDWLSGRICGLALDYRLLAKPHVEATGEHCTEGAYITDWAQPKRNIPRVDMADAVLSVEHSCLPALFLADAFARGEQTPLATWLPDQGLPGLDIRWTAPTQSEQGRREVGIAMVWAWGLGAQMWQWALPPTRLPPPQQGQWELHIEPSGSITVSGRDEPWGQLTQPLDMVDYRVSE